MPRTVALLLSLTLAAAAKGRSEFAYVLVNGDSQDMSGSMDDLREAVRLRKRFGDTFLWVRRGDEKFVITDGKLIERVEALSGPQRKLGEKQSELGSQQVELGERQAKLGMEQARLGRRAARDATDESASDRKHRGDLRKAQRDISEQQQELGEQQLVLGREQQKMGREQARLSREMHDRIREIVNEALQHGLARRVD